MQNHNLQVTVTIQQDPDEGGGHHQRSQSQISTITSSRRRRLQSNDLFIIGVCTLSFLLLSGIASGFIIMAFAAGKLNLAGLLGILLGTSFLGLCCIGCAAAGNGIMFYNDYRRYQKQYPVELDENQPCSLPSSSPLFVTHQPEQIHIKQAQVPNGEKASLQDLPEEMILHISHFNSAEENRNLANTCRFFKQTIESDKSYWVKRYHRIWVQLNPKSTEEDLSRLTEGLTIIQLREHIKEYAHYKLTYRKAREAYILLRQEFLQGWLQELLQGWQQRPNNHYTWSQVRALLQICQEGIVKTTCSPLAKKFLDKNKENINRMRYHSQPWLKKIMEAVRESHKESLRPTS